MRRKGRSPIARISAVARFFNSVARFLLRDSGGAGTAHLFVSMRGRRGKVSSHKKAKKDFFRPRPDSARQGQIFQTEPGQGEQLIGFKTWYQISEEKFHLRRMC